jgi:benzoyl-CoA reductase/2-hydroxyglutaryl-CoA dehydratase subunit BcrC/BadD/HgdB
MVRNGTQSTQAQQTPPSKPQSSITPEPQIKALDPAMAQVLQEQIEYLSKRNSGIKTMDYFYQIYKELYGNRVKELMHQKQQGKKIVGIFCNFIPLELILAANAIPIRLCTGFQDPILPAEEILPRNFCPLIKSSYGSCLIGSPHFELADVLIIPTTCDGKKKLAEILADRKQTWVVEVPHTTETPQARRLWLTEIKLLKKQLEHLTGNKISSKKIKTAIELVNKKRAVTRRLYELRKRTPPPIWGRDALLVTNLALYDDILRWIERTEALCIELEHHKPVCDISFPRVMLTGSPTVFPTWKIPILLEESGGVIVMDDICTGSKELWDPIEAPNWSMNDMLISIADKYLMNTCACFTPNLVRLNRVIQFAQDFKIDGVLYHVLQACHIYGMEELRIEKSLDKLRIPVLNIETDYSQEDVEQIRTRIEAFLEIVSIRKMSKPGAIQAPSVSVPSPAGIGISPGTAPSPIATQPQSSTPVPTTASVSQPTPNTTSPTQVHDPTVAMTTHPQVNDPTAAMTTTPQVNDPTAAMVPSQQSIDPTPPTPASAPRATPAPSPPTSAIPTEPLPGTKQHPTLPPPPATTDQPESEVKKPGVPKASAIKVKKEEG